MCQSGKTIKKHYSNKSTHANAIPYKREQNQSHKLKYYDNV